MLAMDGAGRRICMSTGVSRRPPPRQPAHASTHAQVERATVHQPRVHEEHVAHAADHLLDHTGQPAPALELCPAAAATESSTAAPMWGGIRPRRCAKRLHY
jgi:hypothetical protein